MSANFSETVVRPEDHLLLVARTSLTAVQLEEIRDRIPERLRGRVIIADNFDGYVIQGGIA